MDIGDSDVENVELEELCALLVRVNNSRKNRLERRKRKKLKV